MVVDNSQTESACEAWKEFAASFSGQADYVSVLQPGLSLCRNTALSRSTSQFVVFLDDDVTLPTTWFAALSEGLKTPGTVAAGGPIRLMWEGGRPSWLRPEYETFFSGLDLGQEARQFHVPRETPYGANIAVHRSLALENGGFDTKLGRAGTGLLGGEEIDLILRLAPRGAVRYVPDAWVYHHVDAQRTTRRWLLRRYFAQGKTNVLVQAATAVEKQDTRDVRRRSRWPHRVHQLPYSLAERLGAYAGRLGGSRHL